MPALRSFFSARISSCSDSNPRTSSSVYSYVLTRLSSSKRVDILTRTLADSGPFQASLSATSAQSADEVFPQITQMYADGLSQHHHRRALSSAAAVGVVEGFDEIER